MGLRVNSNLLSTNAQRNLQNITNRLGGNFSRLSSGLRITTAADDAAGLGISERMRADIASYGQAARNTQDGISLVQTAEGALGEVSSNLGRLRELAVQSSNGTLSDEDRDAIDEEFQALVSEIDRIAAETDFNGVQLLDGTVTDSSIQVGIDSGSNDTITVDFADATATGLGVNSLNVQDVTNSNSALATIDTAIDSVNTARSELGASQNRLQSAFRSITNTRENLSAAESRIRDVDVASETADLSRNSILQQAATSVLAQANAQPQLALSLL